jgi:hypothetical protein
MSTLQKRPDAGHFSDDVANRLLGNLQGVVKAAVYRMPALQSLAQVQAMRWVSLVSRIQV